SIKETTASAKPLARPIGWRSVPALTAELQSRGPLLGPPPGDVRRSPATAVRSISRRYAWPSHGRRSVPSAREKSRRLVEWSLNNGVDDAARSPATARKDVWQQLSARLLRLGRRAQAGQEVHEAHDVLVAQGLRGHGHGAVEVRRRLGLEAAEEPEEVVVVLSGQSRHLLLSREVGAMAGGAVMERGEPLPLGDLVGIGGGRTLACRLLRVIGGEVGHLGVGEILGEGRHLRILASAVAKLDELPVGEEDRLTGEARRPGNGGVAVGTVAGRARLGLAPPR